MDAFYFMVSIFESLLKIEKLEIRGVKSRKYRKFLMELMKWAVLALFLLLAGMRQLLH